MSARLFILSMFFSLLGLMIHPTGAPAVAHAQEVFSTTGSGGSGGGALASKANALASFAHERHNRIEACGNSGKIYAPDHARADANGCIQDFEINAEGKGIFQRIVEFLGGAKLGFPTVCNTGTEGTLRYDTKAKQVTVCDGESWATLAAGGGLVDGMINYGDCKSISAPSSNSVQCGNDYAITATICSHANAATAANCSFGYGHEGIHTIAGSGSTGYGTNSTAHAICCRYKNHNK